MRFPRQEYWSGLPFSPPRDLPNPDIEFGSSALQADSLLPELPGKPFILLGLMGRAHNQMSPSPGFLAALWELNHESALH